MRDQIHSLATPLPEDILKRKWGGDLEGAIRAIDIRLEGELPQMLRERLIVERERIRRLPTQYPWNREQAIRELTALIPDMTGEEFDRLELEGRIDFLYIGGEKRYFNRFHRTLIKTIPAMMARTGNVPSPVSKWLDPMIGKIRENGSLSFRITIESRLGVKSDSFVPGTYRFWLPVAAPCAQQSRVEVLAGDPDSVDAENSPARTAYWEKQLTQPQSVSLRYAYTSTIRYADPLNAPVPSAPLYPDALPVEEADLGEELPYIRFTPYLRDLAKEIAGDAETPVEKAWRFYSFVTRQVKYSFMRDYFQIDDLGEYCAVNLKGDCGLQALLFIGLCRVSGIPARWQSGLCIDGDSSAGSHDWAQFWLEGWGWLFADPSFGGSAWRAGSTERNAFYFGNLDPMRMVANRRYQAPLTPAIHTLRVDPYDNQSGEAELVGASLPFTGRDLEESAAMIACTEL